jgi:RNA polymerase sigma-70 factor (ECF subfamily)
MWSGRSFGNTTCPGRKYRILLTSSAAGRINAKDRDAILVERAAGGDDDAFDALITSRLERLFRIARAILRDDPQARDVVQDACLQAWRELASIRDPSKFDGWLTQIVVNGCRSQLRRTKRRQIREIAVDDPDPRGRTRELRSEERLLADQVVDAEAVRRAFVRLSPDQRTLLVLHYVDDRPINQIAGALRIPSGTVKWRLSRARDALERALEAER